MTETAFDTALRAAREAKGTPQDLQRLKHSLQQRLANAPAAELPAKAHTPAAAISVSQVLGVAACVIGLGALGYLGFDREPAAQQKTAPVVSPTAQPHRREPVQPSATPNAQPSDVLLPDARTEPKAEHPRARTLRTARTTEPKPVAAVSDPAAEISLITRAQSLLDQHPQAALAALIEHAQRFPHGVLAEERDGLRFDAERALGHTADAIAHARAFCAQYPGSPQTRRLERWLATHAAAVQP